MRKLSTEYYLCSKGPFTKNACDTLRSTVINMFVCSYPRESGQGLQGPRMFLTEAVSLATFLLVPVEVDAGVSGIVPNF